jgi:mono/diheme cytochrome c family protein
MIRAVLVASFAVAAIAPAHADEDQREAARYILEKHCGVCHRDDSPDALPAALRVFDLDRIDFQATMSDAQLRNAKWRLEQQSQFSDAELHELSRFGGRVAPADLHTFDAFVTQELARRHARRR